uniref:Uncharacterized protein n=1 Tax=Tanacetum cinerariifolium TaxID=118510 RepID=A0A699GXM0_TANCI|nr:hypothetical protein [Tanacetum cinerariifolium]
MGDEVISTTIARENDEFIKSSVDDLVPIPRESEVTLDSNLECDMPVNTLLPTTDDINSPLGEHVVDFLIENEDIADLPKHLVKQLISHLVKNPSSTKRMSRDEHGTGHESVRFRYDTGTVPVQFQDSVGWEDEGDGDPFFWFSSYAITPSWCIPPNEVMYRYYHPHLTSGDGFNTEIKKIPSNKSKVHIEVLSVLCGNMLPIPDDSLPLSR